jgi:hypothetical protein
MTGAARPQIGNTIMPEGDDSDGTHPMNLDELLAREAIRALLARCAQAGDSLRKEEYANCFTEDGVLRAVTLAGHQALDLTSRAAILAWQGAMRAPRDGLGVTGKIPLTFARHNLTTSKIELTGQDSAAGRTYWFVVSNAGPDHSGVYRDRFARVDGEWLIAERRVKTEWRSPHSLMAPPARS